MILVEEAEKIILSHYKDFGTETIPVENSLNRILAEDLFTDRDLPPFNQGNFGWNCYSTMTSFEKGIQFI